MMMRMLSVLFAGSMLIGVGCNNPSENTSQKSAEKKDKKEASDQKEKKGVPAAKAEVSGHDWWCDEHGVKEAECSMCSAKVAKAFQDKGDWCKEHSRAKSQCFICDPSLKDKYAAEYKAKFGKEPPEPEGQKPEKK